MRVVLLGPPGAGKGTQCKRIIEKYSLVHLSSGDILRSERSAGSELGKEAQKYMDSGDLVPDDLIIKMMIGAMKKAGNGYVLDGFPRTVLQGSELDKALSNEGEKIDAVVNLLVADENVASRMTGRRSCPVCGEVYHIDNLKPKVQGKCDKGCGDLVQRPDDTAEVVTKRLKTYHEQTEPVLGYYKEAGTVIIDIDAAGEIDDITAMIFAKLDPVTISVE